MCNRYSAMASANVRISNAVSGVVLVEETAILCAGLVTTVRGMLGSRASRHVTLFYLGCVVDVDFTVPDGAEVELTAAVGDALTFEDRDQLVHQLRHACHRDVRGRCARVFATFSTAARDDRSVVLAAVGLDRHCFQHASEALRNDGEVVSAVSASSGQRNVRPRRAHHAPWDTVPAHCLDFVSGRSKIDEMSLESAWNYLQKPTAALAWRSECPLCVSVALL